MEALLQHFHEAVTTEQDVEELKKLILKLAVRGKLVEQDPNDEPASELLKKIEKEKERLIAEKKIKKSKVPQAIANDEIPYELPKGWVWVKCVEIFYTLSTKNSLKSKDYLEEGKYPIIDQGKKFIAGYTNNEEAVIKIEYPITVFGDHTKEVKFVDFDFVPGADGTKLLCPFAPIYPKYFYWVIRSYELDDRGYGRHFKLLKEQLFPLPPVNEQIRIVEKIEALYQKCDELLEEIVKKQTASEVLNKSVFTRIQDYNNSLQMEDLQFAIENIEHLCNTKEDIDLLRNSILSLAVQGKLVKQNPDDEPASVLLQKIKEEKERLIAEKKIKKEKPLPPITPDEIPFEIPDNWQWVRLADICTYIQRGKSPVYSDIEQIPVVSQKCVQWSGFDITKARFIDPNTIQKYQKERFLQENDLLWNSTGQGTLGRINVFSLEKTKYKTKYKIVVADSHVTVIRPFKSFVMAQYLNSWFSSPFVQDEINDKSTGSTKQTELSITTIKEYVVPLPPLEEQKRIVERIEELFALINQLEQQIIQYDHDCQNLMKAVLHEALHSNKEKQYV